MAQNTIQIGDAVRLCLIRQMEREDRTGIPAHVYESRVTNIDEDGGVELYMPTEGGKAVLFPLRVRLAVLFDTKKGVYRALGLVEERYRANNRYMLRIGLKSCLYHYHMQSHCRISYAADMVYFAISPEQALKTPAGQFQKILDVHRKDIVRKQGVVTGLSADGAYFTTDAENEANTYILMQLRHFLIPAYLLSSRITKVLPSKASALEAASAKALQAGGAPEGAAGSRRFENKVEFIWTDHRIQEDFIRFIFDERRKNRKKEVRLSDEKKYFSCR